MSTSVEQEDGSERTMIPNAHERAARVFTISMIGVFMAILLRIVVAEG